MTRLLELPGEYLVDPEEISYVSGHQGKTRIQLRSGQFLHVDAGFAEVRRLIQGHDPDGQDVGGGS